MKNHKMAKLRGDRSLHEMARELEMPYSTYAMIESGHRFPRPKLAIKIANHFGVTIDELFFTLNDHETRSNGRTAS